MTRGAAETLRAKEDKPSETWQKIIARNGTQEQLEQLMAQWLGTTFEQDKLPYRVKAVMMDDLKRIILIGERASI